MWIERQCWSDSAAPANFGKSKPWCRSYWNALQEFHPRTNTSIQLCFETWLQLLHASCTLFARKKQTGQRDHTAWHSPAAFHIVWPGGSSPIEERPLQFNSDWCWHKPHKFQPQEELLFQILDSGIIRPQALCVREGPSLEKQIWIHSAACMASSVLPVGAAKGCNAKWQKSLLIRVKFFGILCCWC